ncbi:MAG TPA: flagellar hook-length control protein FliK, partial [Candidatus Acidoferrum sp.]|nr:flagellar hook-length control protein FliK [Candidatus Acidoferrum sp.]
MQPTANSNILTLLLGAKNNPNGTGVSAQPSSGDLLFGDIIGLLTNAPNSGAAPQNPSFDLLLGDLLANPAAAGKNTDSTVPASGAAVIPAFPTIANLLTQLSNAVPTSKTSVVADNSSLNLDNDDSALPANARRLLESGIWPILPRVTGMSSTPETATVGDLINPLTNGTYTILKATTVDDRLNLEVASKKNPEQIIKLSIPIASLQTVTATPVLSDLLTTSRPAAARVPLNGAPQTTSTIDQLLQNVNLREIEIRIENPQTTALSDNTAVQVSLTADKAGSPVILTGAMNSSDLQGTLIKGRKMAGPVTAEQSTDTVDGTSIPRDVKISTQPETKVANAVAEANQDQVGTPITIKRALTDSSDGFSLDKFTASAGQKSDAGGSDQAVIVNPPAARFSLPDDLSQTMKSPSQSVMLKIEPEHLGPARLNLSVRNDVLTARLTVDTPQAKAAVENSLDKLTDQLSRVGIKVEHIEVSLRNGDSNSQFAGRHADWFRPQRHQVMRFGENFVTAAAAPVL